jgi:hypothetical protein
MSVMYSAVMYSAGKYVDWGVIHVSVTNLLIIVTMVVVFALALVLPFPKPHEAPRSEEHTP